MKMKSRLPFCTVILAGLFFLQGFWWSLLLWRKSEIERNSAMQVLQERLGKAEAVQENSPGLVDGNQKEALQAEAWSKVSAQFPGIVWIPPAGLQISEVSIHELDDALRGQRIMIVGESSAFLIVTLLGLGLMLRTFRREKFLTLQQSNFLHAVTHEFRSPLQSLQLALETLIRRPNPQRAQSYADNMLEDIARLEGLVDNLLAVGRLETEPFLARSQVVELTPAIRALIDQFQLSHPTEPSQIQTKLEDDLLAEADPSTLEPVLRNLLDNALKYGEGKPVSVSLVQEAGYAQLTVSDSGRGIGPDELPHIYKRFWRAGDERVRTAPGTGLGLFLTRELLKTQGAAISARSDGPGKGASFQVRWPLASG